MFHARVRERVEKGDARKSCIVLSSHVLFAGRCSVRQAYPRACNDSAAICFFLCICTLAHDVALPLSVALHEG